MYQPIRTIHIYYEEEEPEPIIDAGAAGDPEPEPENRQRVAGVLCAIVLVLLCVSAIVAQLRIQQLYQNTYDTTITRSISLTLSLSPAAGEVRLYQLAEITIREQATVSASGSLRQPATHAIGLVTFYNGTFTAQRVAAGTEIKGRDGVIVVTAQSVIVPAATPTTPPTDGTVSVTAYSTVAGEAGNIAAQDINHVCCGGAILAQNLYAFSGGESARNVPVLTKDDIQRGQQQLSERVNAEVQSQAQREEKPGDILLPLSCERTPEASHQAGDQVATAVLTLVEICHPLAYLAPDIAAAAQRSVAIPRGYHLASFSAFVYDSHLTPDGGTLDVQAIAYLKRVEPVMQYRFGGK